MPDGSHNRTRQQRIPRTLADTLEQIRTHPDLSRNDRRVRKSSFGMFARATRLELEKIPETIEAVDAAIKMAAPAKAGISTSTWRTVKSHIRTSLPRCGVYFTSARNPASMSPAWRALLDPVPPNLRSRLLPIAGIMTKLNVEPAALSQEHVKWLWQNMDELYPDADAHEKARVAIEVWNRCTKLPHWPKIRLEPLTLLDPYTYPSTRFSKSFNDGVAEIRRDAISPRDGKLDPCRPKLASTAKDWCDTIYEVASAYCQFHKIDPMILVSPQDVFTWQALDDANEFWIKRLGVEASPNLERRAYIVRALARRHASPTETDLEAFNTIIKNVTSAERPSNNTSDVILRLKNPAFRAAFLQGPERVIARELAKPVPSSRSSTMALKACAWALLLAVPLEPCELANLLCHEELPESGEGVKVVVEHSTTRRDVMPVPPGTVKLIIACRKRFARLLPRFGDQVFAGRDGAKRPANLSVQVSDLISNELGCRITAGQLRFLVAGLYLLGHPRDFETIRRYLRWKRAEAVQNYFGFLTLDSSQRTFAARAAKTAG